MRRGPFGKKRGTLLMGETNFLPPNINIGPWGAQTCWKKKSEYCGRRKKPDWGANE